jgi:hypothetical protein
MYFWMGRSCGNATQIDSFYAESITSTEDAAYVIKAPHIVQYDDKRQLVGLVELFHRQPFHLYRSKLAFL